MRDPLLSGSPLLPEILHPYPDHFVSESGDTLSCLAMRTGRPCAKAIEALEGDAGFPLKAAFETQDLALLCFGSVARLVAELCRISQAIDRSRTTETKSEIAGRVQPVKIGRRLFDMTQPPESVQPVKRQGRMDAQRQLMLTSISPFQVRVFGVGDEIPAQKISVAIHLEAETCGELFIEGKVVGEVDPAEPHAVLPLNRGWIRAADSVLVPVVVPVVVPEHQPAELAG